MSSLISGTSIYLRAHRLILRPKSLRYYDKSYHCCCCVLRKPTRDITVNIFSAKFFFISARFFFISARFFLFPQCLFFYFRKVYLSPQGCVHFRKVCFISARLYYLRKVYFISARLSLFPRGSFLFRKVYFTSAKNIFVRLINLYNLYNIVRSAPLRQMTWAGPTSTLVVTIENIFAEIKITLRK